MVIELLEFSLFNQLIGTNKNCISLNVQENLPKNSFQNLIGEALI